MRMVVTGREGQIVRALLECTIGTNVEVVPVGRPELDLAGAGDNVVDTIVAARPDIVVSAAAYTHVDKAETEPDLAFAVNARGPRFVALAAREVGVPLIHLSTDYVFDGQKTSPYNEKDSTRPTGVYGASKLAGEEAVLTEHEDTVVLRTAWVFSQFGTNFAKTMLRLAGEHDEVAVVADQWGNPSSALEIARAILTMAATVVATGDPATRGIFHMAGRGEASWADFAERIFLVSAARGGPFANVRRIETADFPTLARRPLNSRLNCGKLACVFGIQLPDWRCSVDDVVGKLVRQAR